MPHVLIWARAGWRFVAPGPTGGHIKRKKAGAALKLLKGCSLRVRESSPAGPPSSDDARKLLASCSGGLSSAKFRRCLADFGHCLPIGAKVGPNQAKVGPNQTNSDKTWPIWAMLANLGQTLETNICTICKQLASVWPKMANRWPTLAKFCRNWIVVLRIVPKFGKQWPRIGRTSSK